MILSSAFGSKKEDFTALTFRRFFCAMNVREHTKKSLFARVLLVRIESLTDKCVSGFDFVKMVKKEDKIHFYSFPNPSALMEDERRQLVAI